MSLTKRKITRKRNREWRKFFKKVALFLIVFGITLTSLTLLTRNNNTGLLSPLSFAKSLGQKQGGGEEESLDTTKLKKALAEKKFAFSDIKVSSDGAYMVKLKTGEQLILSSKKDLTKQLSSLQVIYSRLTMEGRGVRSLDFRYDKPIVVFK